MTKKSKILYDRPEVACLEMIEENSLCAVSDVNVDNVANPFGGETELLF